MCMDLIAYPKNTYSKKKKKKTKLKEETKSKLLWEILTQISVTDTKSTYKLPRI